MKNDEPLRKAMEEIEKFQELTSPPVMKIIKEMEEIKKFQELTTPPFFQEIEKIQALTSPPVMKIVEDIENMNKPSLVQPQLPPLIKMPVDQNLASEFHTRLIKWIHDFDSELDHEHEVGVRLVSFGQTITFHLHDIGYWNPSLISFYGSMENGDPVVLIQHVSQISILLVKMKREDPTLPKRPVGFAEWDEERP